MSAKTVESMFKFVFFLAIVVFIVLIVSIFLMLIKIVFLFLPEGFVLMGIKMTPAILQL